MAEIAAVALNRVLHGRVVRISMVAPMPPVGTSALPLLYTRTEEMPSDAKLPKSKDRPGVLVKVEVGI